jgi:hypothetical protein
VVICGSCAAESVYDALQIADVCPYCDSNQLARTHERIFYRQSRNGHHDGEVYKIAASSTLIYETMPRAVRLAGQPGKKK